MLSVLFASLQCLLLFFNFYVTLLPKETVDVHVLKVLIMNHSLVPQERRKVVINIVFSIKLLVVMIQICNMFTLGDILVVNVTISTNFSKIHFLKTGTRFTSQMLSSDIKDTRLSMYCLQN